MEEIAIQSRQGVLSATFFEAKEPTAVLIIASATGVKQGYYQAFAQFVASHGIHVMTFDYVGIGRSLTQPIKTLKNHTADWGKEDLEQVIQYVREAHPTAKKFLLGHSIGGQLVGLSKSATQLDKLVLVAAQSGYWRFWKGTGQLKMWFNWYVLFPVLLRLFGYLPSKRVSGMENLPKQVANQWRNWGKHPDYLFGDPTLNPHYYDQITSNITSISIADDEFAPREAVEWMMKHYANANIRAMHWEPKDFDTSRIGHFGVFKERFRDSLWKLLLEELR